MCLLKKRVLSKQQVKFYNKATIPLSGYLGDLLFVQSATELVSKVLFVFYIALGKLPCSPLQVKERYQPQVVEVCEALALHHNICNEHGQLQDRDAELVEVHLLQGFDQMVYVVQAVRLHQHIAMGTVTGRGSTLVP